MVKNKYIAIDERYYRPAEVSVYFRTHKIHEAVEKARELNGATRSQTDYSEHSKTKQKEN